MSPTPSAIEKPVVMTIAGSDSGGGAGLQTDLKTFAALDCFGTCAVTCVTAQCPAAVNGVESISPAMVASQVRTVCGAFPVKAAKTGMLFSASIIDSVCTVLDEVSLPWLVVDPVMIATSGGRLIEQAAMESLERLLRLADVITPNIPEAEALLDRRITGAAAADTAAHELGTRFQTACLLKGGHLESEQVTDILWDGEALHHFELPRLDARETHGTGCTFAAAMTAHLAHDRALPDAARAAQQFVARALAHPIKAGSHYPLGIHHSTHAFEE